METENDSELDNFFKDSCIPGCLFVSVFPTSFLGTKRGHKLDVDQRVGEKEF